MGQVWVAAGFEFEIVAFLLVFFGLAPLVAATGLLAVCFVRAMTVLGFVVFTALILHSYSLISSLACSKYNFL